MNYIYVSTACPDEKYKYLFEKKIIKSGQQAQKFNNLLIKGIGKLRKVTAISSLPVSLDCSKKIIDREEENIGNIKYVSTKIYNLLKIRSITNLFSLIRELLKETRKNADSIIICDAFSVSCSLAVTVVAKLRKIKRIAVVTDLPQFLETDQKLGRLVFRLMQNYDRYVLLTQQMSQLVNIHSKPEIIIEGSCDMDMAGSENHMEKKKVPKSLVFTGSLTANVGIEEMLQAFIECDTKDFELRIFGSGELAETIANLSKVHTNIKYYGQVDNARAVQEQISATLLLNPRFSDGEYTKYSFPSKIIEYMASGTPVLTTALPGIPNEYFEYMYVFEHENLSGYKKAFSYLLKKSPKELHSMGIRAKKFVIQNKTNAAQADRIVKWAEDAYLI